MSLSALDGILAVVGSKGTIQKTAVAEDGSGSLVRHTAELQ